MKRVKLKPYEVYIARYKDEVMYVGEGKKFRHRHIISGTSHVYLANAYHFSSKVLDIEVIPFDTKDECVEEEARLIKELDPKWNNGFSNIPFIKKRHLVKNYLRKDKTITLPFQKNVLWWLAGLINEQAYVEMDASIFNSAVSKWSGYSTGFLSRLEKDAEGIYYKKLRDILLCEKIGHCRYKITFKAGIE